MPALENEFKTLLPGPYLAIVIIFTKEAWVFTFIDLQTVKEIQDYILYRIFQWIHGLTPNYLIDDATMDVDIHGCDIMNDIMMTSSNGNIFRVAGPWCGEFTGHRWIPLTKANDTELWCFLWSAPELKVSKQSRRRWFKTSSCSL